MNAEPKKHVLKDYLASGGTTCLHCLRPEISGDCITVDDSGYAFQDITCDYCGAAWTDVYRLASVINFELPEGDQ